MIYYDYINKVSKNVSINDILSRIDTKNVVKCKPYIDKRSGKEITKSITYQMTIGYEKEMNESGRFKPIKVPYKKLKDFIAFDSESTSLYHYENDKLVPFISSTIMFQFNLSGYNFYCRTMNEFIEFIIALDNYLKDNSLRMKWYVHNLSYDLFYIIKSIAYAMDIEDFGSYILGDDTGVFRFAYPSFNIEFQCSYKLFDNKLSRVASDYNCEHQKTKDWDYKKFRTSKSKLTPNEIYYAIMDVQVLYEALTKKINSTSEPYEGNIWKLPCSKTGEVRLYQKEIIGKEPHYFKDINECKNDAKRYHMFQSYDIIEAKSFEEAVKNENTSVHFVGNKKNKLRYALYYNHELYVYRGKDYFNSPITINEYDTRKTHGLRRFSEKYGKLYSAIEDAYTGGFTHANRKYLGVIMKNVGSIDLVSAYPSVMVVKKFVNEYTYKVTPGEQVINPKTGFIDDKKNGYLLKVKYTNLEAKYGISLISTSKCKELEYGEEFNRKTQREYIDNGRLIKCESCVMYIYDMDFNNIRKLYNYDNVEILEGWRGIKERIPDSLLFTVLKFYRDKCYYKALLNTIDRNKEPEKYDEIACKLKIAKTKLNSIYGCTAMDEWKYSMTEYYEEFVRDNASEEEKKQDETDAFNEWINTYIGNRKTVSGFTVGGQITSYVREQIIDAILIIGPDNFIYSDTDSIKFRLENVTEEMIAKINKNMQDELDKAMDEIIPLAKHYGIETSWYNEVFIDDESKKMNLVISRKNNLNKFELEAKFIYFKTLGAKRYVCFSEDRIDGVQKTYYMHCTVAGIPKNSIRKYLQRGTGNRIKQLNRFNKGIYIDKKESHKATSVYIRNYELDNKVKSNTETYKGILPLELAMHTGYEYFEYIKYENGYKLILEDKKGNFCELFTTQFILIQEVGFAINSLANDVEQNIYKNFITSSTAKEAFGG